MKNVVSKSLWTMNAVMAAAITVSGMTVFAGTAHAESRTLSESQKQRLADTSARLNLSASQEEQVKPILRASMQKQKSILNSYGFSQSKKPNLSFRQKLSLRDELSAQRNETNSKLSRILSKSQIQTLANIQAEQREKMKARIRG